VKKGIKTRPLRARSQPEATGKRGYIKTWYPWQTLTGVHRIRINSNNKHKRWQAQEMAGIDIDEVLVQMEVKTMENTYKVKLK